jgi:hypothetical protein
VANIWVYWTSPNVFPRYVLMLFPLLYAPCVYLYFHEENRQIRKYLDNFFLVMTIVVVPALWVTAFVPDTQVIPNLFLKLSGVTLLIGVLVFYMIKKPRSRIFQFCISIMIVRFAFDLLILPTRADNDWIHYARIDAENIGKKYIGEELKVYPYDHLRYETGFYITRERGQILRYTTDENPGTKLIVHPQFHKDLLKKYPVVDSMRVQFQPEKLYIINIE